MIIVATTVWIDYLNGAATPETEWLDREAGRQRIGLLDLCVCEIPQGLPDDAEAARLREGHAVLHSDHDFDPFEEQLGLQVVHP